MYLENDIAVDVMNHVWERKFVYCSEDTLLALRMETKGQTSHYLIQSLMRPIWMNAAKAERNDYNSDISGFDYIHSSNVE